MRNITARRIATLRAALGQFLEHPSPRLLIAAVTVFVVTRVLRGDWGTADTVAVAIVALQWPMLERVLHVYVLHVRPHGRFTNAMDWAIGRSHRAHHADPNRLDVQFIHPHAILVALVIEVAVAFASPVGHTVVTAFLIGTLTYEWFHYLIHTDVPARNGLYRRIHRAHRLHHYRNERYWFGVTSPLGDIVLRTYPDKNDVEVSATARTALAGLRQKHPEEAGASPVPQA